MIGVCPFTPHAVYVNSSFVTFLYYIHTPFGTKILFLVTSLIATLNLLKNIVRYGWEGEFCLVFSLSHAQGIFKPVLGTFLIYLLSCDIIIVRKPICPTNPRSIYNLFTILQLISEIIMEHLIIIHLQIAAVLIRSCVPSCWCCCSLPSRSSNFHSLIQKHNHNTIRFTISASPSCWPCFSAVNR